MALKKLQTEIEKVLKKVAEGVEVFESIFEKIQQAPNPQKEKLEAELKKEIKKLQRYRDQIKTWLASNEIKDKRALLENRKLIESQMEKFKACEKELKTKAYSKEGLSAATKVDPLEKEKAEIGQWITDTLDKLQTQIDAFEAEAETLQVGAKKSRKPDQGKAERLSKIEHSVERHKYHQQCLEIIHRLLENGDRDLQEVKGIQEDVDYYANNNQDPGFQEYEEIYDDLNLEDAEVYGINNDDEESDSDDDAPTPAKEKEKPGRDKDKEDLAKIKSKKDEESEVVISPSKALPPKAKPAASKPPSVPVPNPKSSATPASMKPPMAAATRPPLAMGPAVVVPQAPPQRYAAAVAASSPLSVDKAPTAASVVAASVVAGVSPTSSATVASMAPLSVPASSSAPVLASTPVAASISDDKRPPSQRLVESSVTPVSGISAHSVSTPVSQSLKPQVSMSIPGAPESFIAPHEPLQSSLSTGKNTAMGESDVQSAPTQEPIHDNRLPATLADLVSSFEVTKERSALKLKEDTAFFQHMLDTSFQFIPEPQDSEKPKHYMPKVPFPVPSYYPQTPLPVFDSAAIFEKLDIDTLFFIFYYQQGTYQQYLAARELKRQSWRFHKKYLTWFQRHEEPKAITDEYEQGTYVYFDYEGTWCQRKKGDFRFDYKWLEDEGPSAKYY